MPLDKEARLGNGSSWRCQSKDAERKRPMKKARVTIKTVTKHQVYVEQDGERVVGQFDCGGLPRWKTGDERRIMVRWGRDGNSWESSSEAAKRAYQLNAL
jgi:hypothetical protein